MNQGVGSKDQESSFAIYTLSGLRRKIHEMKNFYNSTRD